MEKERLHLLIDEDLKEYLEEIGEGCYTSGFKKAVSLHKHFALHKKVIFLAAQKNKDLMKFFLKLCE